MRGVMGTLVLATVALAASCLPIRPPAGPATGEEFAVADDGGLLVVPVAVQGAKYSFIVCTGAHTLYDAYLQPLMGPRVEEAKNAEPGTKAPIARFTPPEAYLGKLPLPRKTPVPVSDLAWLRKATGQDIRGCIGMDFLEQYVVGIDIDAGKLTLRASMGKMDAPSLPLFLDDQRLPWVEADAPGLGSPERFLVSTASNGTMNLQATRFDKLVGLGKIEQDGVEEVVSLDDPGSFPCGQLEELRLGAFTHRQLLVKSGKRSTLGLAFWSRYHVILDFPHGRIYLRRGKRFDAPEEFNRSGLTIQRKNDEETVVSAVKAGSPGEKAGVRPGDLLVSVGGLPTQGTPLISLWHRLSAVGEMLEINLKRNGAPLQASLQLEAEEPPAALGAK